MVELPIDEDGRWVPFEERPRPDADLAKVSVKLDWKHIEIAVGDEAAVGRIFAWLMGQMMLAKAAVRD